MLSQQCREKYYVFKIKKFNSATTINVIKSLNDNFNKCKYSNKTQNRHASKQRPF